MDEDGIETSDSTLIIKKFEIDGYLGMLFESNLYKEPMVYKTISFSIIEDNEEQSIEKEIEFFRPDILVVEKPKQIEIEVAGEKIKTEEKIVIRNAGHGTGLINLKVKEDSELLKIDPQGINEFVTKFWADVENKLMKLKKIHPDYSNLTDNFLALGREFPSFDDEGLPQIKEVFTKLDEAFENNPSFAESFVSAFLAAYLKNISIITEVESFVTYLKSIYSGRIILLDAVKVFRVSSQSKTLKAKITVTDLAYNAYEPIDVNIQLRAKDECDVPLYSLFKFVSDHEGA